MRALRLLAALFLIASSLPTLAATLPFYRIIVGPRPATEAEVARDRTMYGTEVLYTGDVPEGSPPRKVNGIVWHSNLEEARYFVGVRNPVVEHRAEIRAIEADKWIEAQLLRRAIGEQFPRTDSLESVLASAPAGEAARLEWLKAELARRYPRGYFLKPISSFNAVGTFATESTDFAAELSGYQRLVKPKIEAYLRENPGETTGAHLEFKGESHYVGRVIEDLLRDPRSVIVQEKIDAAAAAYVKREDGSYKAVLDEYRVHVVEGRVLVGATEQRWDDYRSLSPERLREVEAFAQSVIDRLPEPYRRMCFGMDVMRTKNGGMRVIELNPGGESSYLYPEIDLWVTHLLAERYLEKPTWLGEAARRIEKAENLAEIDLTLTRLYRKPGLKALFDEGSPVTEVRQQARKRAMALLRAEPTPNRAALVAMTLAQHKLGPYLSSADVELLARLIGPSGLGAIEAPTRQSAGFRRLIGLENGEIVFWGPGGEARYVGRLGYDDSGVAYEVATSARRRSAAGQSGGEALEREIELEIDRRVVTASEYRAGTRSLAEFARSLGEDATKPLLFTGSRVSLVRQALRLAHSM